MRPVLIPIRLAIGVAAVCAMGLIFRATPASAQAFCVGDCNSNNEVLINELITCVNTALGGPLTCTQCDANGDGMVLINELVQAVGNALGGCNHGPTPTATSPVESNTPTATPTTVVSACPLDPGKYTITSLSGGKLTVATFAQFDFPAGGAIVADVSPGDADCRHSVVVPFPGGFVSPVFCVPALGLTTSVTQTACGIGQIDSDGGSDYTVKELGDTSDSSNVCNLPQATCPSGGPAPDSNIRVQITVGDGTPDVCTGGATVNALLAIPVDTRSWLEASALCGIVDVTRPCSNDGQCAPRACMNGFCANGADGTFNPPEDAEVSHFPQILDFTTDATSAKFQDLDGNGCFKSGSGPVNGFAKVGTCMDLSKLNTGEIVATTAATGVLGSSGSPFDIAFATTLPNKVDGPEPLLGATCDPAPVINFSGVAERCIKAAAGQ